MVVYWPIYLWRLQASHYTFPGTSSKEGGFSCWWAGISTFSSPCFRSTPSVPLFIHYDFAILHSKWQGPGDCLQNREALEVNDHSFLKVVTWALKSFGKRVFISQWTECNSWDTMLQIYKALVSIVCSFVCWAMGSLSLNWKGWRKVSQGCYND